MPDDVLLLRADTNLWTSQEERTVTVPASTVVFADGLVLAYINPFRDRAEWRAIQLTPQELETVHGQIIAIDPRPAQLAGPATCMDCGVSVIWARSSDGDLVEMAIPGLYTRNPEVGLPPGVPPSMVALSLVLDHLEFLAEHRKEVATTREAPQIPAGAYIGG
jgi:hypothetical protein